jgi:hypothetical protein
LDNLLGLILVIAAIVFFLWLGWKLRLAWKNFLFSLRKRRGKRGETKAIKLLEKHGYQIIQAQVTLPGYLYVDDDRLDFDIRPDYLVERDGVQYLAEVKTGDAAKVVNRSTRRQLFEYARLGSTDTIVLVDATTGTVSEIRFEDHDG